MWGIGLKGKTEINITFKVVELQGRQNQRRRLLKKSFKHLTFAICMHYQYEQSTLTFTYEVLSFFQLLPIASVDQKKRKVVALIYLHSLKYWSKHHVLYYMKTSEEWRRIWDQHFYTDAFFNDLVWQQIKQAVLCPCITYCSIHC